MSKTTTEALVEPISKYTHKPKAAVRRIIKNYLGVVEEEAREGSILSVLGLVWLGDFKKGIEGLESVQNCVVKASNISWEEGHRETPDDYRAVLSAFQQAISTKVSRNEKVVVTGFGTFNEDGSFKKSSVLSGVKVTLGGGGRTGL